MKSDILSAEEIRAKFFGTTNGSQQAKPVGHLTSEVQQGLTASAKYVIRECKRRLGQLSAFGTASSPDEKELRRLVELVELEEGEDLSEKERTQIVAVLSASLDHYDILTPLIENESINDIIVRAYNDISVQTGRENIQTDLKFSDHETYSSFIENLLKRAGKACTAATPVVDAAIDPHIRACVTHESYSPPGSGPMLTLRIARHRSASLDRLTHDAFAPTQLLAYLATVVREAKSTILIAGEVGTGKTTLVRALASTIKDSEAILIIEDTHEIVLERRFVRTLLTREANTEGAGRISPAQAIHTGMRMAMNRIILGEMRGPEAAEAFIDVCASGHPGMSTIHAKSAKDALGRLELLLSRAQGNVTIQTIRRQIANAVSVVVYLGIDPLEGKRRILEVIEVGSSADGLVQVSPIFTFDKSTGSPRWTRGAGISIFNDILKEEGVVINNSEMILSCDMEQS